jgi:CO/xanthine dehydrogenase Mo-binding subunit
VEKPPFVDDIVLKHCLTGILLRSPVKEGILREIKTPRLPYNVSLITAGDIPGANGLAPPAEKIPVFAGEKLSWYGQPAALLVGPDPARLRELAEQCEVIAENAEESEKAGPVILERTYDTGGADRAFEEAALVVEGTYASGVEAPWPGDPPGALAVPGPGGTVTIHTASQWSGHVKASVAAVLGIRAQGVDVVSARLETRLDGKIWPPSLLAAQAALAARIREKPVKLVLGRKEDLRFSPGSAAAVIRLRSALDKNGRILGTELEIDASFGAAGVFAEEILDRMALGALGAYHHGNIRLRARGRSRPLPPAGPAGGFGLAQGFFAAERHASRIAEALGEDPAEWRKNLSLRRGRRLPIGVELRETPPLEELLDSAAAMADYRRKRAAYEILREHRRSSPAPWRNLEEAPRGIGIALAWQGASFLYNPSGGTRTPEGVELTLEKDGTLTIKTSLPWGDNQLHCWRTLAAKILGVETIRALSRDAPESGPACLSRSIAVITPLIEKACAAIRRLRFRDPLPITVHRYYHPARLRPWPEEKNAGASRPEAPGPALDGNALLPLSWGSAVVEAAVDPVDYSPRIRGIWMTLEAGTILSEERARKSVTIQALQALSWTLGEEAPPPGGADSRGSGIAGAPPVSVDFLWSGGNPRGIGELPRALVPAACVQALSQALDYPLKNCPVTGEELWRAARRIKEGE